MAEMNNSSKDSVNRYLAVGSYNAASERKKR